jgi:hypothetical protein
MSEEERAWRKEKWGDNPPVEHHFRTLKEAKEYIEQKLGIKAVFPPLDASQEKIAVEAVNAFVDQIEYFQREYPDASCRIAQLNLTDPKYNTMDTYFARCEDNITLAGGNQGAIAELDMTINGYYAVWRKDFNRGMEEGEAAGFHPRGEKGWGWNAIATHECAHILTWNDVRRGGDVNALYEYRIAKYNAERSRYLYSGEDDEQELERRREGMKMEKFYISKYAEKNTDEFLAESYCEAIYDPDPSPHAIETKKLIDKQYRRKT